MRAAKSGRSARVARGVEYGAWLAHGMFGEDGAQSGDPRNRWNLTRAGAVGE